MGMGYGGRDSAATIIGGEGGVRRGKYTLPPPTPSVWVRGGGKEERKESSSSPNKPSFRTCIRIHTTEWTADRHKRDLRRLLPLLSSPFPLIHPLFRYSILVCHSTFLIDRTLSSCTLSGGNLTLSERKAKVAHKQYFFFGETWFVLGKFSLSYPTKKIKAFLTCF